MSPSYNDFAKLKNEPFNLYTAQFLGKDKTMNMSKNKQGVNCRLNNRVQSIRDID